MLPTEVQRILLLIGLAATGYLMILAWNDDFMKSTVVEEYASEPELAPIAGAAGMTEEPLTPVEPAGQPGASDVPDASNCTGWSTVP